MLYIVSTPIGNLEDITYRAVRLLKECDLILCEDTRRSKKILSHYGFSNKLSPYNDINKRRKTNKIIKLMLSGKNVCLVSDSGTPCINDPGFYLIRESIKNEIDVVPIPGPSSILASLVVSGLPTDKFTYLGFIPKTSGKRIKFIQYAGSLNHTAVLLESPYRIHKSLKVMNNSFPQKDLAIAREITKKFEEFIRGTVSEVYNKIKFKKIKGEIVLILH